MFVWPQEPLKITNRITPFVRNIGGPNRGGVLVWPVIPRVGGSRMAIIQNSPKAADPVLFMER